MLIFEYNVQSVNDTREPTKTGQQDVNEKVDIATTFQENSKRRKDKG